MTIDIYEGMQEAFEQYRRESKSVPTGRVVVSDHALVRWLERGHGIEMEAFREMLAGKVANAVAAGASSVKIDGLCFILRRGVLVTVMDKPHQKSSRRRHKGRGR